jgi:alcohol dehydrogenase
MRRTGKMNNFSFVCRTRTGFGVLALDHLPFELAAMGVKKALVIHDFPDDNGKLPPAFINAFKDSEIILGLCRPLNEDNDELKIVRSIYDVYIRNGFDALIAFGRAWVANIAKLVNAAVSLGPDILINAGQIKKPLKPLVYVATGVDTAGAVNDHAFFRGRRLESSFLVPDLAVADPAVLISDTDADMSESAFFCFAAGCEIYAISRNPMARAYASAVIQICVQAFDLLLVMQDKGSLARKRNRIFSRKDCINADLVQAGIMTGCIMSCNIVSAADIIGRAVSESCRISQARAMMILLPAVLEYAGLNNCSSLLLPLKGPEKYSCVPKALRAGAAIHFIRSIVWEMHLRSRGEFPVTLEEAGLDNEMIPKLGEEIMDSDNFRLDPELVKTVLACTLDGRPVQRP